MHNFSRSDPRRIRALALCLCAVALAAPAIASAQPRRPPQRRTGPSRRRPPPPPPPPPQVVDTDFSQDSHTGPDPFSDTSPPHDVAPPEPSPDGDAHHPAVDVELQYRIFSRSLSWDGDTQRAFRPYGLDVASAARVAGEVYPLRAVTHDAISHLGITGSFATAFMLDSADTRGHHFDTTMYDVSLGLRYRFPLRPTLPDLGLSVAWSRQVFFVRASDTQALGGVPDLVYDGMRFGLSARFAVAWRLSLRADVGFTYVFSTGELGDAFLPHVSTYALDAGAALVLRLWEGLEARAGVDVREYEHSANREAGDRYVVSGGSDRYLSGTFGLAWRN